MFGGMKVECNSDERRRIVEIPGALHSSILNTTMPDRARHFCFWEQAVNSASDIRPTCMRLRFGAHVVDTPSGRHGLISKIWL